MERGDAEGARRDAVMGQIKLKTAVAILQAERARARIVALDAELVVAREEEARLDEQLAAAKRRWAPASSCRDEGVTGGGTKSARGEIRDSQEASRHGAAKAGRADGGREASRRGARRHSTDGARDSNRGDRGSATLREGKVRGGHEHAARGPQGIRRGSVGRDPGQNDPRADGGGRGDQAARPRYEAATAALNDRARDRALEADATAVVGVRTRLERDGDLQRLVLPLPQLFARKQSVLLPEGAKVVDAVKDLLTKYPTYPVQVTGFTDGPGAAPDRAALSLARANAVYWALVTRGIDPKRLSVDGKVRGDADDNSSTSAVMGSRVELSILYHIGQ